ncbi:cbb3-type cytochrome c oxidase subunit I [Niallia endozanthoxylica]|uniref:Cytochrome-c oxidase n=1 Tax=Niallia endozanthoxylica TaxID=2036016 RepID=A0A5J5HM28_9BACI|nr:cbb3-type cytochrome c oxidase subunit I [Niallia endozanthoxylica]KAA9021791.1 cytochrome-c oxidase [Niallia endozanthoxylica]
MGVRFLKIAAVYFLIAVVLGLVMGIIHNFSFTSVHAHLNLLGWVSMALFGLIYCIFPKAGETKLAKTHFWLHNIGLPLMQGVLFVQLVTGNQALVVGTIIGSLLLVLGVVLFVINVLAHIKTSNSIFSGKDISM